MRQEIKPILEDEVLDQHCQNLRVVMETKQLFLRPNLSLMDLSNEAGIQVDEVKKVLSERLQLSFFGFISE